MNKIKLGCRLIACLIVFALIVNFENLMILQANTSNTAKILLVAMVLVYLILNLLGALGLFLGKMFGFWITYLAIAFTTIFFSMSYIPLINSIGVFFPENIRYIPFIIGNLIVLIFTAYLHVLSRQK